MTNEQSKPLDRVEEIVNWTLPGLTMYYRDTDLSPDIIDKYETGKIFRSRTFVDVSNYAGKPTTNCRFVFASSKAAPLFRINPETEKWGLHAMNCNSYFKVLDVYRKENITQIFLLHIPYKGIDFFSRTILKLGNQNIEEQIIGKARNSLNQKLHADVPSALNEEEWLVRTGFPIGLDFSNEFFSLEPAAPLPAVTMPMFSGVKKMTNDLTDLNEAPIPDVRAKNPISDTGKQPKKKGGFWSNLFGKS